MSYRLVVESWEGTAAGQAAHLHWYARLVHGTVTPGGFELAAGMAVNPAQPEQDVAALRAVWQR